MTDLARRADRCKSAWGPDADRRRKLVGADPQRKRHLCRRKWRLKPEARPRVLIRAFSARHPTLVAEVIRWFHAMHASRSTSFFLSALCRSIIAQGNARDYGSPLDVSALKKAILSDGRESDRTGEFFSEFTRAYTAPVDRPSLRAITAAFKPCASNSRSRASSVLVQGRPAGFGPVTISTSKSEHRTAFSSVWQRFVNHLSPCFTN
jgi:hypothetical protein